MPNGWLGIFKKNKFWQKEGGWRFGSMVTLRLPDLGGKYRITLITTGKAHLGAEHLDPCHYQYDN